MVRIICSLFTLLIINTSLYAQMPLPGVADPLAPGENIYRHYTGTIGNHKAVLDLRYGFQGASNFGGSTVYFTDEGGLKFFLISQPPSFLHTEVFRAQIFPENVPLSEVKNVYSIFVQTTRFEFTLSHDSLIGKWLDPNAQAQTSFVLKEDNSNALPFVFRYGADSTVATGKNNKAMKAVGTYKGVQPSPKMKEKDVAFVYNAVARFMGIAKTPNDLAQICLQQFLGSFDKAIHGGKEPDGSSFSGNYTLFPVYNDNGFLVLQKGGYQYDFEKNEYSDQYQYLCLDVKNKKTLALDDVLAMNNDALANLLESAFRKKYQLEAAKKLNELFNTDKMPLSNNFMLVSKGLIFSYYPGKIFRESEDIAELQEMRLFLSFEELGGMVKPEFKTRMGGRD